MYLLSFLRKIFGSAPPTIHFDKPYCKIYYHGDIRAVHLDWSEQATTTQFIEACDFSLNLLVERKAFKMIADNSKVSNVSEDNQNWLIEDWFPRAVEEGFQYSAVIQSNKDSVKSALQLIVSKVSNKHVIVQYFEELSSAKAWLAKAK